jgi:hypothetical protein
VKRYVAEAGSGLVREAMTEADRWLVSRVGYVECMRAVTIAGGAVVAGRFRSE